MSSEQTTGATAEAGADGVDEQAAARGLLRFKQMLVGAHAWVRRGFNRGGEAAGAGADESGERVDGVAEGERVARVPRSFSLQHTALIAMGVLLVGVLLGVLASYSRFAEKIGSLSTELETQQASLQRLKKEHASMQRESKTAQDNLLEMQRLLKASQRALAQATTAARNQGEGRDRVPVGISSMPRGQSRQGQPERGQPAAARQPPPGGLCDIHASSPAEGLARCIESFNRGDR